MQNKKYETLTALLIGIAIYGLLLEVAGIFLIQDKKAYTMGLLFGCIIAAGLAIHMYWSITVSLVMEEKNAAKFMSGMGLVRYIAMLAAIGVGLFVKEMNFLMVAAGILGLKFSALAIPHVWKRFRKKQAQERG